jgi:hypothetical protein
MQPFVIFNNKGAIVKISRCVIKCHGNEWFVSQVFRTSESSHYCTICDESFAASDNKYTNIIKHIQRLHQNKILPYEHINAAERARVANEWKTIEADPDKYFARIKKAESTKSVQERNEPVQTNLHQYQALPITTQQRIWAHAIPLGMFMKRRSIV